MKNPFNYFRSYEKVKLGKDELIIEHSALENLVGFGGLALVMTLTSPIWIPYGLYKLGEKAYSQIKEKKNQNNL